MGAVMQMSSQGDDDDTPKSQQHHHVSFAIAAGGGSAGGGNHESSPPALERARGGSGTAQPLSAIDPGDQVSSRHKDGNERAKSPAGRCVCTKLSALCRIRVHMRNGPCLAAQIS